MERIQDTTRYLPFSATVVGRPSHTLSHRRGLADEQRQPNQESQQILVDLS